MKILWLSHFIPYPDTGHGALQRSKALITELAKHNELYLVSYDNIIAGKSTFLWEDIDKDLKKYFREVHIVPYTNKHVVNKYITGIQSIFSTSPISIDLYRSEIFQDACLNLLARNSFDVCHADTMGLIDHVLYKVGSGKVLNHHNVESHLMKRRAQNESNVLKKMFFALEAYKLDKYEKRICTIYDLNLFVSQVDMERMKESMPGIRGVVVENSVDCNYFFYSRPGSYEVDLTFAGSLDWHPNADAMIYFCEQIWPFLKMNLPSLKMNIIGRNPPRKLEQAVAGTSDVRLIGFVDDVRPWMEKARIYVCPFREGGGTKLKILDALSQGIPIIASSLGIEGLDVHDNREVLVANSQDEWLARIKDLLGKKGLYDSISRRGRSFVEQTYSKEVIGRKLSEYYKEII